MDSSILHVITSDYNSAHKLLCLFETVKINVSVYKNKDVFLARGSPDFSECLLIDINSPQENWQEIFLELKKLNIFLPIVIITNNNDIQEAINAMKLGAIDFILKPYNEQVLIETIQKCLNAIRVRPAQKMPQLSRREQDIMTLVMEGKLNKQIADELYISISTVEHHRRNIMTKLEAKNMAQLISIYYQAQLDSLS
jgi:FixJ family two-component response regulator